MITSTWKKCTEQPFIELYTQVINKAKELGYLEGYQAPPLYWVQRKNTMGLCSYKFIGVKQNRYGHTERLYTSDGIALNIIYKNLSPQECLNTLVHEVTHFCAVTKYGREGSGHNYYFYLVGDKLGNAFNTKIERLCSKEDEGDKALAIQNRQNRKPYVYETYCTLCGHVIKKYTYFHNILNRIGNGNYYHTTCGQESKIAYRKINNN